TQFALSYQLMSGPAPTMLRWLSIGANDPAAAGEGTGPTMYGKALGKGGISVAAVRFSTPSTPEPYTSQGGNIPILFDSAGNRLAQPDIRVAPVVAAPDDVHTSFYGQMDPGDTSGFPSFSGTSAAAPHVAAAAALLLQSKPTATPAEIMQHLQQTALDINTPGFVVFTG